MFNRQTTAFTLLLSLVILALSGAFLRSASAQSDGITVTIPNVDPDVGQTVTLSIEANLGSDEVDSYTNMEFTFDGAVLDVEESGVRDGDDLSFGSDNFVVNKDDPNTLRVSNIAPSPVSGSGEILEIDVTLTEDAKSAFELTPSETGRNPTSIFQDGSSILEITQINQGAVNNRAPTVNGALPDATLQMPGPPVQVQGLGTTVFVDSDGDELTFSASSGNSSVVGITDSSAPGVVLDTKAEGTATVTITASDGVEEASTSFAVTVEERSAGVEEPVGRALALFNEQAVDESFHFGDTDVTVKPISVGNAGLVRAERFDSPPDGTSGIDEETVSEYRVVLEGDGSLDVGAGTEVRFPVDAFGGIDDPSAVQVYRRPSPGTGTFTPLSTSVDESEGGTEIVSTTDSFSEFVLASDANPLPVELTSFSVHIDEGEALLEWQTASETSNAGFEVQHRKVDEDRWRALGFVDSNAPDGTSTEPQSYRFSVEDDLRPGTHRFRLKQVDLDGKTHFSGVVRVDIEAEGVTLTPPSPSPTSGRTSLTFAVREAVETQVAVYNVLGQKIETLYRGTPRANQAEVLQFDTTDLPSGVYIVQLQTGGQTETRRLTVVR